MLTGRYSATTRWVGWVQTSTLHFAVKPASHKACVCHVVHSAFTSLLHFLNTATSIGERRCFRSRGVEPRCPFRGLTNVLSACIRRFVEAVVRSTKCAVTRQFKVVVTTPFDRTSAKAGCHLSATTAWSRPAIARGIHPQSASPNDQRRPGRRRPGRSTRKPDRRNRPR